MFEARLTHGDVLKKVIESITDLVKDANFECSATGFGMQAMDNSHVSLVALLLRADGFEHYRCDRGLSMGMNVPNLAQMLKVRVPLAPLYRSHQAWSERARCLMGRTLPLLALTACPAPP